jgi:hypothetical protein|nr:MAG TPA: hypothetical protein [Caudoviricetes sp.]
MKTIYGHFDDKQFEDYKVKLHKDLFWLLLYKDPKTKDEFNVDFDKYFINLMLRIDGLNKILDYPVEIITIMSLLQAAWDEAHQDEDFDYQSYRKLILDAHHEVDKINSRS